MCEEPFSQYNGISPLQVATNKDTYIANTKYLNHSGLFSASINSLQLFKTKKQIHKKSQNILQKQKFKLQYMRARK